MGVAAAIQRVRPLRDYPTPLLHPSANGHVPGHRRLLQILLQLEFACQDEARHAIQSPARARQQPQLLQTFTKRAQENRRLDPPSRNWRADHDIQNHFGEAGECSASKRGHIELLPIQLARFPDSILEIRCQLFDEIDVYGAQLQRAALPRIVPVDNQDGAQDVQVVEVGDRRVC